ncbi:MAG: DNA polymerase III subunit gamma/tau [Candidatus Coproplasma sp.]
MAYLAFYRTFRPTRFEDVVRQEHIVRILKNRISTGNIGHAYLFCGPRGTGKTTLAKIFARAINCENPVDGSPCGVCPTCKALAQGNSLDISEIDAASNNGVDEMRDLREKVQYPPVTGRYKVYIIDEVHMLTQSAFNAVLKTLEEPPRHAVFILATTEPQKIPATILSRCMRFDFKLIPQADLEELIKSVFDKIGKEYESEAISEIARAGAGSARDSLSIADMCSSYSTGKLTYDDVNAVLGNADFSSVADLCGQILCQDASSALSSVESILSTGKSVGVLCKDLLTFLNNLAIVKMCRNAAQILNIPADRYNKLNAVASGVDGHKILRVTEILSACESDMRFALNGRITLETAVLKCAMPDSDYDIDALLGRVALLEKKLEEGVKVQISSTAQASAQAVQASAPVSSTAQVAPKAVRSEERARVLEEAPAVQERTQVSEVASAPQKKREESREKLAASHFTEEENSFASPVKAEREAPENKSTQPTLWETAPQDEPVQVGSLTEEQKKQVFGKFLRLFRTTRRNAVLFTLCMDLESTFEGDKIIFYTDSDAVFKPLTREDNARYISQALAELGVFSHEVRLKPKEEDKYQSAERRLKENFKGFDIDIK